MSTELFGWEPNPEGVKTLHRQVGSLGEVAGNLIGGTERDVHIYKALLKVMPQWRRIAQEIGDCVSHGLELPCTCLLAIQHLRGLSEFNGVIASEALYGGMRVEGAGKTRGGWSDGSWGGAGAIWARDWGVVLRADYSQQTGNPEHDLREYSGDKAKNWGNFGCGGSEDHGKLDSVSREHPVRHVVQVKSLEELIAALTNGYPVSHASTAGFQGMNRDSRGIVRRRGFWPHQMCFIGVVWMEGQPYFINANSWGASASGPFPSVEEDAIKACSWLVTPEDARYILNTGDCWAYSDVSGFPPQELDFLSALEGI